MKLWRRLALVPSLFCALASPSFGQDVESRLKTLEDTVRAQQQKIEEQQRLIGDLKSSPGEASAPGAAGTAARPTPGDSGQAATPRPEGASSKVTGIFGGSAMTNPYLSLIVNTFLYDSNLKQAALDSRTIPGFTNVPPETGKGFNLESAELFIFAPVDPYLNLYANLPVTEDGVELEEAYFVTSSLPAGLQIKGGKFKSGFGRINAQHPHAWDFVDAPLNYRAFMGPEGMGGEKGVQLTWIPDLPVYLQLGVEGLQGENDHLFGAGAKDGPHAFTVFAKTSMEIGESGTILFGPSYAWGKANLPTVADDATFTGDTDLFGFEMVYKWKPSRDRGFTLQSEYLYRKQTGDLRTGDPADPASTVDPLTREQDGIYAQGLYQIGRWRIGARYDVLDLFKKDVLLSGLQQDLGKQPWRATGALEFNPSEFTRVRLQYTRDESSRDGKANNEMYLQMLLGIGAHAAHSF
ncbi:hypothetical protein [Candidatus Deferrimicrobium sp.]|uniref:hypothetical protein n=1 Tax=Candidatus Deferrimicrobium sp. TaxID=3060586 RepID=UPI003C4E9A7D